MRRTSITLNTVALTIRKTQQLIFVLFNFRLKNLYCFISVQFSIFVNSSGSYNQDVQNKGYSLFDYAYGRFGILSHRMSIVSIPHSVDWNDNVKCTVQFKNKYATIDRIDKLPKKQSKLKSLTFLRKFNKFTDYDRWHRDQRPQRNLLVKSVSDAQVASGTMKKTLDRGGNNRSVNRDGSIARNTFRGVPGDILDKQTKRFLLSMTVSIHFLFHFFYSN